VRDVVELAVQGGRPLTLTPPLLVVGGGAVPVTVTVMRRRLARRRHRRRHSPAPVMTAARHVTAPCTHLSTPSTYLYLPAPVPVCLSVLLTGLLKN